jgi:aryl-alcohol dehydrogenase
MQIIAAVTPSTGADFEITYVTLDDPRFDEVRVRLVATGICHTDAVVRDGVIPTPLPAVLGHEGAGIVTAVGSEVTTVAVGDHVVLSVNSCGTCMQCLSGHLAYCVNMFSRNFAGARPDGSTSLQAIPSGDRVSSHFFGQSSFATFANVAERSVVKVDKDIDLTIVGSIGCGMQTGAGAVLNELQPAPGSAFAVLGAGAVGAAAIMAAVVAGCAVIIAVDVVPSRLELALELGATHVIDSSVDDVRTRIEQITAGAGLHRALDTTGRPDVLRAAADSLGIRGRLGLVGGSASGTESVFEIGDSLTRGWSFTTIIQGSAVPQTFVPALISLWRQGKFPMEKLVRRYQLDEINDAFRDSASGATIKPVIVFAGP